MTEIGTRADFSIIRYAQCWEDADILLEALLADNASQAEIMVRGESNALGCEDLQ